MTEGLGNRRVPSSPPYVYDNTEVSTETLPPKRGCYLVEISLILFFLTVISQQLLTNFYLMERLMQEFGGDKTLTKFSVCDTVNKSSPEYLLQQKIQQDIASWQILFLCSEGTLGLLLGLIIGPVTDHFGRKTGLTMTLFGSAIKFLCYVVTIKWRLPLWIIIVGSAFFSLTGGSGAFVSSSKSYIADRTNPGRERTLRLSIANSSSYAIGAIMAYFYGYIIHVYGNLCAASILLCITLVNLLFVIFVLTESLPSGGLKKQRDFSLSQIFSPLLLYVKDTRKKRRLPLLLLLAILFLSNSTGVPRVVFLNLYLINIPLCLDAVSMGMFITITGVGLAFVTVLVLKIFQYFIPESLSVIISLLTAIAGNLLLSVAKTTSQVYTAMAVGFGINIPPVISEGAMSLLVDRHEQGTLFASTSFVKVVSHVAYTVLFNSVYSATLATNPGFVFQLIAAILLCAILFQLLLIIVLKRKVYDTTDQLLAEKLRTE